MTTAFKLYFCMALLIVAALYGVKMPSIGQISSTAQAINPITATWNQMSKVLDQANQAAGVGR